VFPLPHLALFGLLALLQLRAVCLAVLQQAHHRAQSNLAVTLWETMYSAQLYTETDSKSHETSTRWKTDHYYTRNDCTDMRPYKKTTARTCVSSSTSSVFNLYSQHRASSNTIALFNSGS
jgi:Tfp pilus assembly protein PilV